MSKNPNFALKELEKGKDGLYKDLKEEERIELINNAKKVLKKTPRPGGHC